MMVDTENLFCRNRRSNGKYQIYFIYIRKLNIRKNTRANDVNCSKLKKKISRFFNYAKLAKNHSWGSFNTFGTITKIPNVSDVIVTENVSAFLIKTINNNCYS